MKKTFIALGAAVLTITAASIPAAAEEAQQVLIGIRQDLYPTSYIDESGTPHGYDIDIIQAIDEKLEQYEFTYEAVSQEALLTGVDTGKYAAAVAGFYSSEERQKKYLFPQEPIGGNLIGVLVREEDADIKNLSDVYDSGKSLEPIAPTSGMYGIVVEYNQENPDRQLELTDAEWTDAALQYTWIEDGRYDVNITSKNVYDDLIDSLGYEDLVFNSFTAIRTWSLFNPDETELAAAYDSALAELKEEGFITEKSIEYFGEDILPYITEEE